MVLLLGLVSGWVCDSSVCRICVLMGVKLMICMWFCSCGLGSVLLVSIISKGMVLLKLIISSFVRLVG